MADTTSLESRLEELLEQEKFPPPEEFREHAVVSDESIYDEADKDYEGRSSRRKFPDQSSEVGPGPRLVRSPERQVVRGAQAQRRPQLRRPPRGSRQRRPRRSTGAARRARSATSPTPTSTATFRKFANALKDLGVELGEVVGIFLPMIPEVAVAMLACARIGAPHNVVFGGFSVESVKERMEVSEAKVLVTVDGARRKGKTAAIKQDVDAWAT